MLCVQDIEEERIACSTGVSAKFYKSHCDEYFIEVTFSVVSIVLS